MRAIAKRSMWITSIRRIVFVALLAVVAQATVADSEYAAAWGPSVGSTAPLLTASDQNGQVQNLHTLMGSKGLLFVFNRSVDW